MSFVDEPLAPAVPESRFDDDRVAALLVEFFAAEMPATLRASTDPTGAGEPAAVEPVPAPARPSMPCRSEPGVSVVPPRRAGGALAGLVAAAACLLVLPFALQRSANDLSPSPDTTLGRRENAADNPLVPAPPAGDPGPIGFALTEDDLFVERVEGHVEPLADERFETPRGPVELRAVRETTHVSVVDPSTGRGVDLETQVLDIEVVPIELEPLPAEPGGEDELPEPRDDLRRLPEAGGRP